MSADRREEITTLAEGARSLDLDGRVALLDALRDRDATLATEVERELVVRSGPQTFFDGPDELLSNVTIGETLASVTGSFETPSPARPRAPVGSTLTPDPVLGGVGDELPERIGRYRILSRLGEGGMGVVYEAEQENPRRVVALEVIRSAIATPAMRRRFEFEAEVLARLEHPGIARIYEVVSEGSLSCFAMEFVDGVELDAYCEREALDASGRLALLGRGL